MRLLIITQKVAKNDPILGFFHQWLEEFAKNFEKVTVICLEEGEHNLPGIKVLSLGKEKNVSKFKYLINFYRYIWQERGNYDAVFVHMNQEYVLLAGDIWKFLGKKIYLWRNHAKGNFWTTMAVWLSNKVFYTSPRSFTARFKKAVQMPVGIDTDFFKPDPAVSRVPNSALFLGRISPVKKVLEFIDWVKDNNYDATIAGPILAEDKLYGEKVKAVLTDKIKFIGPVSQEEAKRLYQTHEIYANFTPAGSFDKTIFEAAACGAKLFVKNPDIKNFNPETNSLKTLMRKIKEEISLN
ncbi:MAG: hypothetical protein A2832_02350 [Candidatus Zambryskibacteria bacterium RIFCSPHIGHO2_01_FULL_44_22b]|uniref:Spore protein YkvP/CgeB glycosyl transferase-like domain-containing protein n=1 Tax=Candidatus Zambryskibacteria bacterium RIFCSPHIGHO2_01_FULL_44_22b TaxID=1802737 RepID=A0A1G2T2B4_9BACT|nr:MAG: hypothetical protein A3A98_02505 [Candidatus Staskawiczbacteria bacterium RIFCSPLOWO2_01_FULL_40_39]OHA91427.1 MAG: hypothetical protein A2832_02350 [Candidatus Zambryskibacteria bacterium RIFCSPHIGHO2_01_FULL_44_22b]